MEDTEKPKAMKVRELIAKLQDAVAANPGVSDYDVHSDGCDCTGDAVDICVWNGDRHQPAHVLVCRK